MIIRLDSLCALGFSSQALSIPRYCDDAIDLILDLKVNLTV